MQLIKSPSFDVNYLSKVVKITEFYQHPNPVVCNLKCCKVDGYNILVSKDSKPGLFVYFPTMSQINPDFLRFANLYSDKSLNADPDKKGMFNSNGRVCSVKLKPIYQDEAQTIPVPGCVSEGFLLEVEIVNNYLIDSFNKSVDFEEGVEFDTIEDNGKSCWFSKKYIPVVKTRVPQAPRDPHKRERKQILRSKLVEGQFRFHYDTVVIKKCPNVILRDDIISITGKLHGTSHISAKLLCYPPTPFSMKVLNFLRKCVGMKELRPTPVYDDIYASRKRLLNDTMSSGYYGCDVWAHAHKYLLPYLEDGMSIYAEILGFLPTGGYIQKNYDYGCVPLTDGTYVPEVNFKVRIYRITMTDVEGNVTEYTAKEVQKWCFKNGLNPVPEYYYGHADALYPSIKGSENWNDDFITELGQDGSFYMEQLSPDCKNKVPHEGIVIKSERRKTEAWKLKCFAFVNGEQKALDKGESNIEDEQ